MKRIINQLIFLSLLLLFAVQISPSPIKASGTLDYEPNQLVIKIDSLLGDINLINGRMGW